MEVRVVDNPLAASTVAQEARKPGANPKGGKEGRRMNDAQILVLIHAVSWPALIWLLSKTWNYG